MNNKPQLCGQCLNEVDSCECFQTFSLQDENTELKKIIATQQKHIVKQNAQILGIKNLFDQYFSGTLTQNQFILEVRKLNHPVKV